MKEIICRCLTELQRFLFFPTPTVTILGYHAVSHDDTLVDITPQAFRNQIKYLKSRGYQFISLQEAVEHALWKRRITKPSVVFTFDDGYADLLEKVAPMLAKNKIPATYFVVTNPGEVNRAEVENIKPLLANSGLKKLAKFAGSDLQGHTTKHLNVTQYAQTTLENDFKQFDEDLAQQGVKKAIFFAFPWGRYNQTAIDALQSIGYQAAVTTRPGFVRPGMNPYILPRIMVDRTHTNQIFPFLLTPLYPSVMNSLDRVKRQVKNILAINPLYQSTQN